jgi:predicted RNA-binding Zn ribbon-like protein
MPVSNEHPPPHGLQLVLDFINTRDIDRGTEELSSPEALTAWLGQRGLLEPDARAATGPVALRRAVSLREALRAAVLAHATGGGSTGEDGLAPEVAATLEDAAHRGRLSVAFAGGAARLEPRAGGIDGALAALLAPVVLAQGDGSWERVKACVADDCRWAFYDRSRNRSGRWCDMAVCGNRAKVRDYRGRR